MLLPVESLSKRYHFNSPIISVGLLVVGLVIGNHAVKKSVTGISRRKPNQHVPYWTCLVVKITFCTIAPPLPFPTESWSLFPSLSLNPNRNQIKYHVLASACPLYYLATLKERVREKCSKGDQGKDIERKERSRCVRLSSSCQPLSLGSKRNAVEWGWNVNAMNLITSPLLDLFFSCLFWLHASAQGFIPALFRTDPSMNCKFHQLGPQHQR